MKKLFIFVCFSAFSIGFAQSKKTKFVDLPKETLYLKFKNSIFNQTNKTEPKVIEDDFKLYYCLIKKYKMNLSDDSIFESRQEYLKKNKDTAEETILNNNYHYYLFVNAYYQTRWNYADKISKCINPKDWKF